MNLSCPKCGSNETQSCQVIFNAGTTSHSSVARDDYGNEVKTTGNTSTNLAQMVAPPAKKENHWIATIVTGILAAMGVPDGSFIWIGFFGLIAFGLYQQSQEADKYNSEVYPQEIKDWENSYYCHKCGNRFIAR